MDSRFGAAPTLARNESKTLIESMVELGLEFEPAPGEHQREGIDQVNDLLYYDPEKPIGPANKPRLLILETCRNVIWALDPPVYFPPEAIVCKGGGRIRGKRKAEIRKRAFARPPDRQTACRHYRWPRSFST